MSKKLNQVVAIKKGVKSRVYAELSELYKQSQKVDLYNGFHKVYKKKDEEGEDLPGERKKVQLNAEEVVKKVESLLSEEMDVEASVEYSNQKASADVVVDGKVILTAAPISYLLQLEKQLNDIHTMIDKIPVLDDTEDWGRDAVVGLHRSNPVETHRTKKIQKALVMYPATDKHPAQTQLVSEDIVVGYWETTKSSGAFTPGRKQQLLNNVRKLLKAVKAAREVANEHAAIEVSVAAPIFDFLLNSF